MTRRTELVVLVALSIVAVVGSFSGISAGFAASPGTSAVAHHLSTDTVSVTHPASRSVTSASRSVASHSKPLAAAASAPASGAGLARGDDGACSVSIGGAAACGLAGLSGAVSDHAGVQAAADPAATASWFNVTANLSTASSANIPTIGFGSTIAYDPLLNELVLWDGDPCVTYCLSNATWVYNGISWTDLSGSLPTAPSPRYGNGLAYDPAFGGVILFGGEDATGAALNDTWLFTSDGWTNITTEVGVPVAIGDEAVTWAWGGMAYDPALNTLVVVDGCVEGGCPSTWGQTWFLNTTGWSVAWGPGTLENLTYLSYSSLAYDAADGYLVSFGGFDAYADAQSNATFTMNATGSWVNITSHDAGCVAGVCYTPPGRVSAGMTWDSQIGAIFMTRGYNDSADVWLNDSWTFVGGAWYPVGAAPATYCPSAWPALASYSDNVAPFISGGYYGNYLVCDVATSEWVYEVAPQPSLTASPAALDLGASTTLNVGWTVGTGSGIVATWALSYGDGNSATPARSGDHGNTSAAYTVPFAHTYAKVGTYKANLTWTDFYYISGTISGVTVTVYPALVATITASATTITAGGSVTFTTSPTGGSGTYAYAWSFGDGTTSAVQGPPAHTYAKAGTYIVNLTVTDTAGGSVKATVTITVNAAPVSSLSPAEEYGIIGAVIAIVAIIAVVLLLRRKKPAPAPQAWQGGSPPAGGAPPTGASGGVPPGAGGAPPPPPPAS